MAVGKRREGYEFDNDKTTKLCARPLRYAATLPASQGIQHSANTGDFDAHIFLCPTAFSPLTYGAKFHTVPALGAILQPSVYPKVGNAWPLDQYATEGCTLYHELFYLTDYKGTSGDPPSMCPPSCNLTFILTLTRRTRGNESRVSG